MNSNGNSENQTFKEKHPILYDWGKAIVGTVLGAVLGAVVTSAFSAHDNELTRRELVKEMSETFTDVKEDMTFRKAVETITEEYEEKKQEIVKLNSTIDDLNKTIKEKDAYIAEQSSEQVITDIIKQATDYWDDEDYIQALILLKKNKSISKDIQTLYEQYSDKYSQIIISKTNELINARKYSEAEELLNETLNQDVLADSSMLKQQLAKIKTNHPVELSKLKMTDDRHIKLTEKTVEDTVGNKYPSGNVFIISAEGEGGYGSGLFYTGSKYQYLSGIIAVSDESTKSDRIMLEGHIEILTKNKDGKVRQVYESETLSRAISQIPLNDLDIENSEWVEIRFYSSDDYFSLAEGYHSLSIILSDFELYN